MAGYFSIPTEAYPSYTLGILAPKTPYVKAGTAAQQQGAGTAGPVTGYDPRYGGIPSAPSPTVESLNAILANLQNLSKLSELTTGASKASAEGARAQILASIPQFDALMGQFQKNVEAQSRGVIDPDVQAFLNQKGAEYGVATGSPGSAATGAAQLRAMGLTSTALKDQALKNMQTLTGLAPTGPAINPQTMMVDPNTMLIYQWLANQLAAAPVPAAARLDELNRQAAALRAGAAAGSVPYGAASPSLVSNPNLSWINRATPSAPSVLPTAGTPTQTTEDYDMDYLMYGYDPRGVYAPATLSSRTEQDIENEFWDEIAPLEWPPGLSSGIPANTYYNPWEDVYTNNPLTFTGWQDTGYTPAIEESPYTEDEWAYLMGWD